MITNQDQKELSDLLSGNEFFEHMNKYECELRGETYMTTSELKLFLEIVSELFEEKYKNKKERDNTES